MTLINTRDDLYELAREDLNAGNGAVTINREVIRSLEPGDKAMALMGAGLQGHPAGAQLENAVVYILALNALNWAFWDRSTDGQHTFSRYSFDGKIGAVAMRAAFAKAWGDDATPQTFKAALREQGVSGLFGGMSSPLLREQCLMDVLEGDLAHVQKLICESARTNGRLGFDLAVSIQRTFPSAYRDVYLKRAQLALAEIAGHLAESGTPVELDVTAFADYQVPRVLRGIGVLEYSEQLAGKVARYELLPEGSTLERTLRGATIIACKEMAEWLGTTDAAIDNYLWTKRNEVGDAPFHLTMTTDY
jgi:hypothetical protein